MKTGDKDTWVQYHEKGGTGTVCGSRIRIKTVILANMRQFKLIREPPGHLAHSVPFWSSIFDPFYLLGLVNSNENGK